MPDHKGFKLQELVNFQKFSSLRVKTQTQESHAVIGCTLSKDWQAQPLLHTCHFIWPRRTTVSRWLSGMIKRDVIWSGQLSIEQERFHKCSFGMLPDLKKDIRRHESHYLINHQIKHKVTQSGDCRWLLWQARNNPYETALKIKADKKCRQCLYLHLCHSFFYTTHL